MTTKRKLPSEYLRQGWCQKAYARNDQGDDLDYPRAGRAVKWCIAGAADAWSGGENTRDFVAFFDHMEDILNVDDMVDWNDAPSRTAAEVIAVAEKAERRMGLRDG